MFKNIYQGKRVLVMGHTGFKDFWLCIWLNELGAEVVGYALDPPSSYDTGILWNSAGIDWPDANPILSSRDKSFFSIK